MLKSSELRSRYKQVFLLILTLAFCIWLLDKNRSYRTCIPLESQITSFSQDLPVIYAITPTYYRPVQKAELTRLSHVFLLVPNLHWIIVEDANRTSKLIRNLLLKSNLNSRSTLLNIQTPRSYKLQGNDPNWSKPRGVEQRNLALEWIRKNVQLENRGIVYFMDDDNAYSVQLFKEMALIKKGKVGVWPVGLVGGLKVEKPILKNDEVIGFNSVWRPERPFPIDMAGFAISSDLIHKYSNASFSYNVQRGYQESEILRQITTMKDLQPLANLCKDILVWHTRTEKVNLLAENKLTKSSDSNMEI